MNADQKKRAKELLAAWRATTYALHADSMADLLQELADAPEAEPVLVVETEPGYWNRGHYCEGTKSYIDPTKVWGLPVGTKLYTAPPAPSVPETEPVARVTGYYAGYLSIVTVDGQVLSTGTALYAAPPHQSEHHLEMVNTPAPSAPDEELQAAFDRGLKAGNEQKEAQQVEIHRLHDLLAATQTQPEPPADLDAPEFSDGCEKEGFPGGCARMGCCKQLPATAKPETDLPTWENGDDPLVGGGLISRGVVDFSTLGIWPTKPAPSLPDGWRSGVMSVIKLIEKRRDNYHRDYGRQEPDTGGWNYPGTGEDWVNDQEELLDEIRAMLAAAPTPAEAPADVARDAARWRMLPAFLEEFEISYLRLEDAIDAAIAAEKGQS